MEEIVFTNRPKSDDFTINFFHQRARGALSAQLACPFFTDPEPVQILIDGGCRRVSLLVRLCEATDPAALSKVRKLPNVDVRYYTSRRFHAKFYVLGDCALVGSANLTRNGLFANRELSFVLDSSDPRFDDIPSYFDELWSAPPAAVLTDEALKRFAQWKASLVLPQHPEISGVTQATPPNIDVASWTVERSRTFLETFRALYLERLIPDYRVVESIYAEQGQRHPVFEGYSQRYELDRFLFWVRSFTTDEDLGSHPIRSGDDLQANIRRYVVEWFAKPDIEIDQGRADRLDALGVLFEDEANLATVTMDRVAELLRACAAFVEMLRFTKGGLENHIAAFRRDNSIESVRKSFIHLRFGSVDFVRRVYDCAYEQEFKLRHWGRNSTLELFGWTNREGIPPINGKAIKALRYLGFDVPY
jgi:hypothetical protein